MTDYTAIYRRRTFVLDTKSICFLCLKNIEFRGKSPSPPSADAADPLDTSSGGNSGGGQGPPHGESLNKHRFSLRSILLYLKLNPKTVFTKVLDNNESLKSLRTADLLKEISNFSVTLCEECLELAERLTEICQQFELVQMKLDHCLESFYEMLAYSESNPEHLESFRKKMCGDLLDSVQKMIAEQLRKDAKSKCCFKLNNSKPRVYLQRSDDPPPETPVITKVTSHSPVKVSSVPVIISTKTLSPSGGITGNKSMPTLYTSPTTTVIAPTKSGTAVVTPTPVQSAPQRSVYPNICGDPNCGPFFDKNQLIQHFKRKECHFSKTGQALFITYQPGPASKSPQSKKFVHLFPSICRCCGFKLLNWSEWKIHTKQRCLAGASEKSVRIGPPSHLPTISRVETLQPPPIKLAASSTTSVELSPPPSTTENLLPPPPPLAKRPPPPLPSLTPIGESFPKTCSPMCGQFSNREEYVNHLKLSCLLNSSSRASKSATTTTATTSSTSTFATPTTRSPIAVSVSPPAITTTTPAKSPGPDSPVKIIQVLSNPKRRGPASQLRPLLPKPGLNSYPCEHCTNAVFQNDAQLFQHKAHLHAEQLFLSCKVRHLSVERFKAYCEQLLQTFVMFSRIPCKTSPSLEGNFTSNNFRCVFCPNKSIIHGWTHFYIHVVKDHQNEIRKKLTVLQETRCPKEKPSAGTPPPQLGQQKQFCEPQTINLPGSSAGQIIQITRHPVEHQLSTWRKQRRSVLELAAVLKKRRESGGGTPKDPLGDEPVVGTPSKVVKLACDICGNVFTELSSLVEHKIRMHSNLRTGSGVTSQVTSVVSPSTTSHDESLSIASEDDSMFEETEVFALRSEPVIRVKTEPVEVKEEEKLEESIVMITEENIVDLNGLDKNTQKVEEKEEVISGSVSKLLELIESRNAIDIGKKNENDSVTSNEVQKPFTVEKYAAEVEKHEVARESVEKKEEDSSSKDEVVKETLDAETEIEKVELSKSTTDNKREQEDSGLKDQTVEKPIVEETFPEIKKEKCTKPKHTVKRAENNTVTEHKPEEFVEVPKESDCVPEKDAKTECVKKRGTTLIELSREDYGADKHDDLFRRNEPQIENEIPNEVVEEDEEEEVEEDEDDDDDEDNVDEQNDDDETVWVTSDLWY